MIQDKRKARNESRRVSELRAKMRQLHDEINKEYKREKETINSPADAANLVKDYMQTLEAEELHVISLDTRNNVLEVTRLYTGAVNNSQIRVGEIFRQAVRLNASAIICTHNHPSGDPTPSPDDIAVTRAIVQAGNLLDIQLLDHIVIGFEKWVSLKERGLGFSC
jgi:DNA repair protein RadC